MKSSRFLVFRGFLGLGEILDIGCFSQVSTVIIFHGNGSCQGFVKTFKVLPVLFSSKMGLGKDLLKLSLKQ